MATSASLSSFPENSNHYFRRISSHESTGSGCPEVNDAKPSTHKASVRHRLDKSTATTSLVSTSLTVATGSVTSGSSEYDDDDDDDDDDSDSNEDTDDTVKYTSGYDDDDNDDDDEGDDDSKSEKYQEKEMSRRFGGPRKNKSTTSDLSRYEDTNDNTNNEIPATLTTDLDVVDNDYCITDSYILSATSSTEPSETVSSTGSTSAESSSTSSSSNSLQSTITASTSWITVDFKTSGTLLEQTSVNTKSSSLRHSLIGSATSRQTLTKSRSSTVQTSNNSYGPQLASRNSQSSSLQRFNQLYEPRLITRLRAKTDESSSAQTLTNSSTQLTTSGNKRLTSTSRTERSSHSLTQTNTRKSNSLMSTQLTDSRTIDQTSADIESSSAQLYTNSSVTQQTSFEGTSASRGRRSTESSLTQTNSRESKSVSQTEYTETPTTQQPSRKHDSSSNRRSTTNTSTTAQTSSTGESSSRRGFTGTSSAQPSRKYYTETSSTTEPTNSGQSSSKYYTETSSTTEPTSSGQSSSKYYTETSSTTEPTNSAQSSSKYNTESSSTTEPTNSAQSSSKYYTETSSTTEPTNSGQSSSKYNTETSSTTEPTNSAQFSSKYYTKTFSTIEPTNSKTNISLQSKFTTATDNMSSVRSLEATRISTSATSELNINNSNMIEINAKAVVLPEGKYEILDVEIFPAGSKGKLACNASCQHREDLIDAVKRNCRRPGKATQTPPVSQHSVMLGHFICDLYNREQLTDVVVKVGETFFNAHRIVLSCHSRHFGFLLMNSKKRSIHDVFELRFNFTPVCFASVLDYMYTGRIVENEFGLVELLLAAIELEMDQLRDVCYRHMEEFTPAQTLRLLSVAAEKGLKHTTLMRKQWRQVAEQFSVIVGTEEFLQLSFELLYRLLSRDDLLVRTERDIVSAAVRWIKGNEDERRRHATKILGCVRFRNLSPEELIVLANREDYMFADPRIRNAILEANWYHTCKRGKGENTRNLNAPIVDGRRPRN